MTLFLGQESNPEIATCPVVILPIPYEATVSYLEGTAQGPQGILAASAYIEETDEQTQRDITGIGIHTLPPASVEDLPPDEMVATVKRIAKKWFQEGKWVLSLGGEHTVSVGAIGAANECFNDFGVLHLDAHHDLRLEYWGSKYSHACVVRRLVEQHSIPIVSVGIRAFCPDEKAFVQQHSFPTSYAWECSGNVEHCYPLLDSLPSHVYITLDVDVLDPSVMPSTGTPEPMGLTYAEVVQIIKYVSKHHTIVGADVVELSPREGQQHADYTAAKLAVQLLVHGVKEKEMRE